MNDQQLDQLFSALSDSTRRAMLSRLAQGDMSVAELAEPFTMSKPAITKHLKVLESAVLLTRMIEGRTHRCQLRATPLKDAGDWLKFYEQFWQQNLDKLESFLAKDS